MINKVQKSGNSLGVHIPKLFTTKAGITKGSEVTFEFKNGNIIIIPCKKEDMKLEDLLRDYNIENRNEVIDWGNNVGREIIN
jgi:antitoxin component of MazEF toxin-antitoxin module